MILVLALAALAAAQCPQICYEPAAGGGCQPVNNADPGGLCAASAVDSSQIWACVGGVCTGNGDETPCMAREPCRLGAFNSTSGRCQYAPDPHPQCADEGYPAIPCVRTLTPAALGLEDGDPAPLLFLQWGLDMLGSSGSVRTGAARLGGSPLLPQPAGHEDRIGLTNGDFVGDGVNATVFEPAYGRPLSITFDRPTYLANFTVAAKPLNDTSPFDSLIAVLYLADGGERVLFPPLLDADSIVVFTPNLANVTRLLLVDNRPAPLLEMVYAQQNEMMCMNGARGEIGCSVDADCDDGNLFSDDMCVAGACVYTDLEQCMEQALTSDPCRRLAEAEACQVRLDGAELTDNPYTFVLDTTPQYFTTVPVPAGAETALVSNDTLSTDGQSLALDVSIIVTRPSLLGSVHMQNLRRIGDAPPECGASIICESVYQQLALQSDVFWSLYNGTTGDAEWAPRPFGTPHEQALGIFNARVLRLVAGHGSALLAADFTFEAGAEECLLLGGELMPIGEAMASSSDGGSSNALLIGLLVGGFVLALIVLCCLVAADERRRRRRRRPYRRVPGDSVGSPNRVSIDQ